MAERFQITGGSAETGEPLRFNSALPCVTSRWLTSLGRKPRHPPHMLYYVKT